MIGRVRAITLILLAGFIVVEATVSLHGQSKSDDDLDRLRSEISSLQRRLNRVRGRTRSTEEELAVIDLELGVRTRELEIAVQEKTRLDEEEKIIRGEIERLSGRVENQKRALASRLAAIYRLGEVSYLKILLAADSTTNPIDALSLMAYLATRDARAIAMYRSTRELYDRESVRLERQKTEAERAHAEVLAKQQSVEAARRDKASLLARLQDEQQSSSAKLATLEEKAARLERLLTFLYERDDGVSGPVRIEEFKGALGWPVQGRVIEEFGRQRSERFATYTLSNGLRIEADPGTEVATIFEGTVLYAQWFKGYGNLVIVDHGHRIFSLYGNTRALNVGAGDRVEAGQRIGIVGEGDEDVGEGFLYFEIRENNEPVNPRNWLR